MELKSPPQHGLCASHTSEELGSSQTFLASPPPFFLSLFPRSVFRSNTITQVVPQPPNLHIYNNIISISL